jgi:hypothetical protein
MRMRSRTEADVLCYSTGKISRGTVLRFYRSWRRTQGLPERCDNEQCQYYREPLEWNGEALPLILDHVNGNSKDNTTDNLRLLCPNCESQLPTRGGKNIGRVQNATDTGYEIAHRDGRRDAKIFVRGVSAMASTGDVGVPTLGPDEGA